MSKGGIFSRDWFWALLVALVFGFMVFVQAPFLEKIEHIAYDAGVRLTYRNPNATEKIAIIAIDDQSIEKIGRWPWPRNVLANMVKKLASVKAKVIGLQIFLTEPQTDPGLEYIEKLQQYLDAAKFPKTAAKQVRTMRQFLAQAKVDLDADSKLAKTIPNVKNILMPMFFSLGDALGNPDASLPGFIKRNRLKQINPQLVDGSGPFTGHTVRYPLETFGRHTSGIGHLNFIPDADGGIRTEPLLLEYYGEYYPSLALLIAARSLNLRVKNITTDLGDGLSLGKLYIKTDPNMLMYSGFYPGENENNAFATYSFYDVQEGKIPSSIFRNKIILIGSTAVGVGNTHLTPISPNMTGPELTANIVTSILNQDFYTRPDWATNVEYGLLVLVLFYLMLALPNMGAGVAAFLSFIFLVLLVGGGQYLMISEKIWLKSTTPALFLFAGHLLLTTKRFFATERLKQLVETDSAQSNRMLGLALQSQGQLDMAMDKFRKLPVDDSVLDLIYNLALDFERKRQFSKAGAAYDYILGHNKGFRDAGQRKQRAEQVDGAVMMGKGGPGATMVLDMADHRPTLGRYEVEKELGKGAMGVVYLGKDPKINRTVAIKTLALSDEFEGDELVAVKERFFREAETAGRLSHPNIVTIYDAGDEHDLAYIAMEFLHGEDLTAFIVKDKQLPVKWVLGIINDVANALDFAHRQDVVHRDIKPANIMYSEEKNLVKVTDFGIARITASSKTKTGVVLGTPSYMSPEQLAGKHVDGRSDLFSLGVMMYEMLCGTQPFTGDSMAALMYQITNSKQKDITKIRPDLPTCTKTIVDKALQKDPAKRYQTGEEFSKSIERCLAKI
jgi:serine/threonine-protein kinase